MNVFEVSNRNTHIHIMNNKYVTLGGGWV